MAHPVIEADDCISCGACVDVCAFGVLDMPDIAEVVDADACTACSACIDVCPTGAITEIAED